MRTKKKKNRARAFARANFPPCACRVTRESARESRLGPPIRIWRARVWARVVPKCLMHSKFRTLKRRHSYILPYRAGNRSLAESLRDRTVDSSSRARARAIADAGRRSHRNQPRAKFLNCALPPHSERPCGFPAAHGCASVAKLDPNLTVRRKVDPPAWLSTLGGLGACLV